MESVLFLQLKNVRHMDTMLKINDFMIVPFETRAYRSRILSSSSRLIAKYFQNNCKNTEDPRIDV